LSEPLQTLWFEDVGFLNEQMLDTPVGRFSIRQTGIFLAFGLLAWLASLLSGDLIFKIVAAGAIFFTGSAIFTRKVKTVPPEMHLLYIIGVGRPLKAKQKAQKGQGRKEQIESLSPSKSMILSATLGVPVKVVGVLKDPALGKPLSSRSFEMSIDGASHSKGFTDEEGFFCAYFVPDRFGVFKIEVKPEGFSGSTQQITVNVKPKEVSEVVETKAKT
jgi:hypothetical protein